MHSGCCQRTRATGPCKSVICPAPIITDCDPTLIPIAQFINASFSTSSVPATIKEAWITPLLKKLSLDPYIPNNYCPITNVTFLLKILELAAYLQIQNYLELHKLLGLRQSGFYPGHSIETVLLVLKLQLNIIWDTGGLAALLLLDLSVAFNLAGHNSLCKYFSTHFSPEVSAGVSSFLSDRTARVFSSENSAQD